MRHGSLADAGTHIAHSTPDVYLDGSHDWNRMDWSLLDTRGFVWMSSFERNHDVLRAIAQHWQYTKETQPLSAGATEAPDSAQTRTLKQMLARMLAAFVAFRCGRDPLHGACVSQLLLPDPASFLNRRSELFFSSGGVWNEPLSLNWHSDVYRAGDMACCPSDESAGPRVLHNMSSPLDRAGKWARPPFSCSQPRNRNFLTLYMPIRKSQANDSNLLLMPVRTVGPTGYFQRDAAGATTICSLRSQLKCESTTSLGSGIRFRCPRYIHAPQLHAGDLLVIRGDVVHASGPHLNREAHRLALAVRVWPEGFSSVE